MRCVVITILFISVFFGCISAKKATPSAIGFITLRNYELNQNVSFPNEINYMFIGNEKGFYQLFHMTKASPGTGIIPDFTAQSVIAIILKPTEKVVSIAIDKAELLGEDLRIQYTITDTTSFKTYRQIPMAVVTIPKSLTIKKVKFYNDNTLEKTINAGY